MRKVPFSEALPHILVGATVITILVVFLVNMFPPLKEAEIINDSSSYSESSLEATKENNFGSSSDPFDSNSGGAHNSISSEPQSGKININTASVSELMTLDGIGEAKAKAIVEYREANGYFKSVNDLTLVSGIGEKTLEKNRDRITV